MAKKKVTRKELLKKPDEFLTFSARAAIFLKAHSTQLSYAGIAVVVGILVYMGVSAYLNRINTKGLEAYNVAYSAFLDNMDKKADQKSLEKTEKLFEKVVQQYGRSKVSRLVAPQVAYIKYREKKYDEAITLYEKFLKEGPRDYPYPSLSRLAIAECYEQKGDLQKAVEILNIVVSDEDGFFKEQAMLALARIYPLLNQKEKAVKVLKEFVSKYKASPFLPLAKAHLAEYGS